MIVYSFKVALFYDKRIYRQIDILGSQTLKKFHNVIFRAFDRDDEHLYSFYLTREAMKNIKKIVNAEEYSLPGEWDDKPFFPGKRKGNVAKTKIASLGLLEKEKLYYLFDFGDEWWHEITLLSTYNTKDKTGFPKITKVAGDSPDQYEYDDEEE